jgi:hypothetical protein
VNHPPKEFGGITKEGNFSPAFVFQSFNGPVLQSPDPSGSFRRWRASAIEARALAIDALRNCSGSSSGFTYPVSDSR